MPPPDGTRFHASLSRWTIGLLVATAFVVAATFGIETLRSDWVLVGVVVLAASVAVAVAGEVLLHFVAGPRSYVVNDTGLWFGRGSNLTKLFDWSEVTSWKLITQRNGNDRWKIETDDKVFTIRKLDVELPSADNFARELETRISTPRSA
ncbi:MAG: hypothetical protein H6839_09950 [Planctomycetes bacterium]|nr:hypothetical protein [Planctomycetota bacterium]